jgi:hypothetical protein
LNMGRCMTIPLESSKIVAQIASAANSKVYPYLSFTPFLGKGKSAKLFPVPCSLVR